MKKSFNYEHTIKIQYSVTFRMLYYLGIQTGMMQDILNPLINFVGAKK